MKMSYETRCKIRRVWKHAVASSLGIFMIMAGVATGWFSRDVVAKWEMTNSTLYLREWQADETEKRRQQIAGIRTSYERLLAEKDARISELAGATAGTARTATRVLESDKAMNDAERAKLATEVKKANEAIKKKEKGK